MHPSQQAESTRRPLPQALTRGNCGQGPGQVGKGSMALSGLPHTWRSQGISPGWVLDLWPTAASQRLFSEILSTLLPYSEGGNTAPARLKAFCSVMLSAMRPLAEGFPTRAVLARRFLWRVRWCSWKPLWRKALGASRPSCLLSVNLLGVKEAGWAA